MRCVLNGDATEMAAHNKELLATVGLKLRPLRVVRGAGGAVLRLIACPARIRAGPD